MGNKGEREHPLEPKEVSNIGDLIKVGGGIAAIIGSATGNLQLAGEAVLMATIINSVCEFNRLKRPTDKKK